MKVKVFHQDQPFGAASSLTHVANIEVGELTSALDRHHLLETAYGRTQNMNGSWSRAAIITGHNGEPIFNPDYHPSVERVAPLPEHDGETFGLRSSMVGDVFELAGKRYKVAGCGFDEITLEEAEEPAPGREENEMAMREAMVADMISRAKEGA